VAGRSNLAATTSVERSTADFVGRELAGLPHLLQLAQPLLFPHNEIWELSSPLVLLRFPHGADVLHCMACLHKHLCDHLPMVLLPILLKAQEGGAVPLGVPHQFDHGMLGLVALYVLEHTIRTFTANGNMLVINATHLAGCFESSHREMLVGRMHFPAVIAATEIIEGANGAQRQELVEVLFVSAAVAD